MTQRIPIVEYYQDHAGEWRWRFVSNGRIMADSAEGYVKKSNARRAWVNFAGYISAGEYKEVTVEQT